MVTRFHRPAVLTGSVLIVIALASWPARAADLHVPGDHPTIQAAIDAALDGDRILVAPGTYLENIRYFGKEVAVIAVGGPSVTTIDGSALTMGNDNGSVVTFFDDEGPGARLEGFTIQGGTGNFSAPVSRGEGSSWSMRARASSGT